MSQYIDVIFVESCQSGNIGEIKRVKRGYAVNYLLPQSKAILANKENKSKLEYLKKVEEKRQAELLETHKKIKSTLDNQLLNFEFKAQKSGKLYGSLSSVEISKAIKETYKMDLDKNVIKLGSPIKTTGEHIINISISKNIDFKMKVNITSTEPVEEKAEADSKETTGKDA